MRRRPCTLPRRDEGFTLIEVLVAMFVFLTGVTGILALMTTALALHRDGLQVARAGRQLDDVVALVRREVSQLRQQPGTPEPTDIAPRRLPDGTWMAVRFPTPRGDEPLTAEIRLAGTQAALNAARPVRAVVGSGLLPSQEARRLRTSRGRAPPENP